MVLFYNFDKDMSSLITYLVERSQMTERMFSRYLQLNRYQVVTQQLFRDKLISRSDMLAMKKRIADLEMDLIVPKQKNVRHPRKITVNK